MSPPRVRSAATRGEQRPEHGRDRGRAGRRSGVHESVHELVVLRRAPGTKRARAPPHEEGELPERLKESTISDRIGRVEEAEQRHHVEPRARRAYGPARARPPAAPPVLPPERRAPAARITTYITSRMTRSRASAAPNGQSRASKNWLLDHVADHHLLAAADQLRRAEVPEARHEDEDAPRDHPGHRQAGGVTLRKNSPSGVAPRSAAASPTTRAQPLERGVERQHHQREVHVQRARGRSAKRVEELNGPSIRPRPLQPLVDQPAGFNSTIHAYVRIRKFVQNGSTSGAAAAYSPSLWTAPAMNVRGRVAEQQARPPSRRPAILTEVSSTRR